MNTVFTTGTTFYSPGNSFTYSIGGSCCILFDRESLPWPSCSLNWKGKQPSWNREGRRFVPDLAAAKAPAYSVKASDIWGNEWETVLIMYWERLDNDLCKSWYWKGPYYQEPPSFP